MRRMLLALLTLASIAGVVWATPNINSAVVHTRIWNDCPTSILTYDNSYPGSIWIQDSVNCQNGYANLHNWRLSEDGVNDAVFNNNDSFRIAADLVISGTGDAESGLQVTPWWSHDADGRFNVRSTDGEIACFGGRLPFYTFTGTYGLHYVKGDMIHLEMIYLPHELTEVGPATMEYKLTYNSTDYTSGPLAFDQGNEGEGYGTWGMLNDARVGAHIQVFVASGGTIKSTWTNIVYEIINPVPVRATSWGKIKAQYR